MKKEEMDLSLDVPYMDSWIVRLVVTDVLVRRGHYDDTDDPEWIDWESTLPNALSNLCGGVLARLVGINPLVGECLSGQGALHVSRAQDLILVLSQAVEEALVDSQDVLGMLQGTKAQPSLQDSTGMKKQAKKPSSSAKKVSKPKAAGGESHLEWRARMQQPKTTKPHAERVRAPRMRKRKSLSACSAHILSLTTQGFGHFCTSMGAVIGSDSDLGMLRSEMLRALDWWKQCSSRDRVNCCEDDMSRIQRACRVLFSFIAFRAILDNHSFILQENEASAVHGASRSHLHVSCDFINRVLCATDALRSTVVRTAIRIFGEDSLSASESSGQRFWEALLPSLVPVVTRLLVCMGLTLVPRALATWISMPPDVLSSHSFAYSDFEEILQAELQVSASVGSLMQAPALAQSKPGARTTPTSAHKGERFAESEGTPEEVSHSLIRSIHVEASGKEQEDDDREDADSNGQSAAKGNRRGRRISFASDSELEEVHDIPQYSKDERVECFYTNNDIRSFLIDASSDQEFQREFNKKE